MREFGRLLKNESKRKGGREGGRGVRDNRRRKETKRGGWHLLLPPLWSASSPPSLSFFFPPSSPHFILYHPLHHFSSPLPLTLPISSPTPPSCFFSIYTLLPPSSSSSLLPSFPCCLPIFIGVPPHPRVSPLRLLFSRSLSSSSPPGCLLNEQMNKNEVTVVFPASLN